MGQTSQGKVIKEITTRGHARAELALVSFPTPEFNITTTTQVDTAVKAVDLTIANRWFVDMPDILSAINGNKLPNGGPVGPAINLTDKIVDAVRVGGKGEMGSVGVCLKDPAEGPCTVNKNLTRREIRAASGAEPLLPTLTKERVLPIGRPAAAILAALSAGYDARDYAQAYGPAGEAVTVPEAAQSILKRRSLGEIETKFRECIADRGNSDVQTCANVGIARSIVRTAGYRTN